MKAAPKRQRGIALLLLVAALAMGATWYMVSRLRLISLNSTAVVRARNIFRKLEAEGGRFDPAAVTPEALERYLASPQGDAYWQLLYQTSQWEAARELAIATTEPAAVAKFAFQLAQAFNNFYHRFRILTEP